MSFSLLVDAYIDGRWIKYILSAIAFGLLLHFRSDYYLMPFIFLLVLIYFSRHNYYSIVKAIAWFFIIFIVLSPWMFYTKKHTGEALFTSTNSGSVLFVGLGQLSGNKWGITTLDADKKKQEYLLEEFGGVVGNYDLPADKFLKRKFFELVLNEPLEYSKLLVDRFLSVITGGMYAGEFNENVTCQKQSKANQNCTSIQRKNYIEELDQELDANKSFKVILLYAIKEMKFGLAYKIFKNQILVLISNYTAVIVLFFSCLFLLGMFAVQMRPNIFFSLFFLALFYQAAINVFAFNMPLYTSNMYVFHLLNFIVGMTWLFRYFKKKIITIT